MGVVLQGAVTVLMAAPAGGGDDLPVLRPPRPEIIPSFGERHAWTLTLALLALSVGLCICLRWALRKRKITPEPAEMAARKGLEALRGEPESGRVLSRISRTLCHYFAVTLQLPPGERTTAEFCRDIAARNRLDPGLVLQVGDFLRRCDERKFALSPPAQGGSAAAGALRLVELAESSRVQTVSGGTAGPGPEQEP